MELQQYWQAIQEKVCTHCMHGDGEGNCKLPAGEECALKGFLPEIILTVLNARTNFHDRAVNVLRRNVCILCDWQLPDMSCELRNHHTCALERYNALVIDTIKNVRVQLERSEIGSAIVCEKISDKREEDVMELEQYWDAIKEKVCKHCIDETVGVENFERDNKDCALRQFFPEIVKMVKNMKSDDINDYVLALRALICTQCTHQLTDSTCKLRKQLDCCLDRYFVLVVNTIAEVDAFRAQRFSAS